ncbi:hypothetical protein Ddye_012888 [Dipteronia dyeriana]|uniref:Peptidyl-prolyl cis-trans isomerase n=1 Tax=Dipteronia dyeriana TaxID=168575 RepID=A0AAD9X5F2_9ROSI|nr:hypothetical protein Ddye_012888 [Dipteronia dyeriana]
MGMYYSWVECHAQVDGFLGASYQKFNLPDETYKAITGYVQPKNSIETFETIEENVSEKETKANPRVFLDLNIGGQPVGRIVIELFANSTLIIAENFQALYTGGCMFNGGDLTDLDGLGGESIYGDSFAYENFVNKHTGPEILSMANNGPLTNNSQFLICATKTEWLDGKNVWSGC